MWWTLEETARLDWFSSISKVVNDVMHGFYAAPPLHVLLHVQWDHFQSNLTIFVSFDSPSPARVELLLFKHAQLNNRMSNIYTGYTNATPLTSSLIPWTNILSNKTRVLHQVIPQNMAKCTTFTQIAADTCMQSLYSSLHSPTGIAVSPWVLHLLQHDHFEYLFGPLQSIDEKHSRLNERSMTSWLGRTSNGKVIPLQSQTHS